MAPGHVRVTARADREATRADRPMAPPVFPEAEVFVIARLSWLACALLLMSAASGLAQDPNVTGRNQLALDIGVLEAGLSYARRIGRGPYSIGAGLRGAWEPWNSFDQSVFEPMGGELFVRVQASGATHLELGPTLLRYRWADDCSECTGTFAGVHAAAMTGTGSLSLGPTARYGVLTGAPTGSEAGFMWGIRGRILISWGD